MFYIAYIFSACHVRHVALYGVYQQTGDAEVISSRKVIQILTANGWVQVGTEGDHRNFKKGGVGVKVTVQHPVKDLSLRNIISIEKATGIRLRP